MMAACVLAQGNVSLRSSQGGTAASWVQLGHNNDDYPITMGVLCGAQIDSR